MLLPISMCVFGVGCGTAPDPRTPLAAQSVSITQDSSPDTSPTAASTPGYKLVWSDEFSGEGLPDPTRWTYDTEANKKGWYNNELQYYSANRAENARVSGGKLIITGRHERLTQMPDYGGQEYSSSRMITRGLASWTYGRIEVSAKLPCGKGTWPAIWMLGAAGDWPDAGEIDIMEQVGDSPSWVLATVHTGDSVRRAAGGSGNRVQVLDACEAFHSYELTWMADSLVFSIDGNVYHRYNNPQLGGNATWPFDKPQYLLLNLALGGNLTGGVVDNSRLPAEFVVDYVRVYQLQ